MKLLGAPALLFALVAFLVLAACAGVALALFTDTPSVPSNAFTSDTLDSPAALSAACGSSIALNWTATPDTYAAGYRVLRGTVSGGPYTQIAQVTPRTTTTYIDTPGAGTYYYVARAFYQNWESANSNEASAVQDANCTTTGFLTCTSNAAVTSSSGDNNGFQLNPGNLCADDSAFAEDTNSGTNTNTTCADVGKDRHLLYDHNLSIPSGSTINGIEVRLDAWADATTGSPFMCVELSWDGGATWTAAKTTPTLGTSETTFILGATTDTWGRTWSAADFANANFRVRITDVASNISRDFRLDWAAVQVDYVPGSGQLTGFLSCSSNAAVTSSSGDNNGFQLNPGNLCANDSAFAEDTNSGTNTNTTCADVGKDRHLLYDHNLSIPSGSTINGIEVRLDAWADSAAGNPFMCVELSWDGGATWTATKTTPTLGTSETTFILGATTDTWGRTWSSGDFSNANLRVRITDVASNNARDFRLDWVAVQVGYTPP